MAKATPAPITKRNDSPNAILELMLVTNQLRKIWKPAVQNPFQLQEERKNSIERAQAPGHFWTEEGLDFAWHTSESHTRDTCTNPNKMCRNYLLSCLGIIKVKIIFGFWLYYRNESKRLETETHTEIWHPNYKGRHQKTVYLENRYPFLNKA